MNLADRTTMTTAEFLHWTEGLPEGTRYELVAGEVVAMSPERASHSLVKLDCALSLRQAVKVAGANCTVFGDGMSIVVNDDTVYEPDVTVQCDSSVDYDSSIVAQPNILVEVLSPSTRGVDTGRKLVGYFQLASVQHYLVIDPDMRVLTHHYRTGDRIGTAIVSHGTLCLDPPGLELDTSDLFDSLP